jgi:hypothetical protein
MNLGYFVSITFVLYNVIGLIECDNKAIKAEFNVSGEGFHR